MSVILTVSAVRQRVACVLKDRYATVDKAERAHGICLLEEAQGDISVDDIKHKLKSMPSNELVDIIDELFGCTPKEGGAKTWGQFCVNVRQEHAIIGCEQKIKCCVQNEQNCQ